MTTFLGDRSQELNKSNYYRLLTFKKKDYNIIMTEPIFDSLPNDPRESGKEFSPETKYGGHARKPFLDRVWDNSKVAIMQEVAPKFGFTIQVLVEEGENYTFQSEDKETGLPKTISSIVPKDASYIRIASEEYPWDNFWKAVEA